MGGGSARFSVINHFTSLLIIYKTLSLPTAMGFFGVKTGIYRDFAV